MSELRPTSVYHELLPNEQIKPKCMPVAVAVLLFLAAGAALVSMRSMRHGVDALAQVSSASEDLKIVYIIRHGEKTIDETNLGAFDYACLSEKGWARAYNLKAVFGPRPQPPFRTPQAIFSANYGNSLDCREEHGWYRTQATIAPLAGPGRSGLDLVVHNESGWLPHLCTVRGDDCFHDPDPNGEPHGYGVCCNTAAAAAILTKLREPGIDTVLVAWEHWNIPFLALALGASSLLAVNGSLAGMWPADDYDRVFALHFSPGGAFIRIETELFQGLTQHGGRWLGPSSGCGSVAPSHLAPHHLPWDVDRRRWEHRHDPRPDRGFQTRPLPGAA